MILKALKWAYGDTLRYLGFLASVFALTSFAFIFISYPWATIATLVGGFGLVTLFMYFSELK